jgi:hypothetical protein
MLKQDCELARHPEESLEWRTWLPFAVLVPCVASLVCLCCEREVCQCGVICFEYSEGCAWSIYVQQTLDKRLVSSNPRCSRNQRIFGQALSSTTRVISSLCLREQEYFSVQGVVKE